MIYSLEDANTLHNAGDLDWRWGIGERLLLEWLTQIRYPLVMSTTQEVVTQSPEPMSRFNLNQSGLD